MQLKLVDHFMFAILSKHETNPPRTALQQKTKICMLNFWSMFGAKTFQNWVIFGRKLPA